MDRHLHLRLKPSIVLCYYSLCLLVLAACAIALCNLHWSARAALAVAAAVCVMRDYIARQRLVIHGLRMDNSDWYLETVQGERKVRLCPDSVVTYPVTVLHFVDGNERHERVLLLPDSCDSNDLRQLRVYLLQYQGQQT